MEMTDGGADYCFECVGMASLVHEAYASCRKVYFTFKNYLTQILNSNVPDLFEFNQSVITTCLNHFVCGN